MTSLLLARRLAATMTSTCWRDRVALPSKVTGRRASLAASVVEAFPLKAVRPYLRLMRADRPTGTYLLFWPCAWGAGLATAAGEWPDPSLLALFAAGSFAMRGAGCVINDLWDRDIDALVERTKTRPLASGELASVDALALLAGQLGVGLYVLLQLDWNTVVLASASLGLVVAYPLAKRITHWPQLALGVTLNWGALVGFSAADGVHVRACLALYSACICWTLIYDTIYAHQDKLDDAQVGVKSTALMFGDGTPKFLGGVGVTMAAALCLAGVLTEQTVPYYLGVATTMALLGRQVATLKTDDPLDCAAKFAENKWIGLIIFLGITLGTLCKKPKYKDYDKTLSVT